MWNHEGILITNQQNHLIQCLELIKFQDTDKIILSLEVHTLKQIFYISHLKNMLYHSKSVDWNNKDPSIKKIDSNNFTPQFQDSEDPKLR